MGRDSQSLKFGVTGRNSCINRRRETVFVIVRWIPEVAFVWSQAQRLNDFVDTQRNLDLSAADQSGQSLAFGHGLNDVNDVSFRPHWGQDVCEPNWNKSIASIGRPCIPWP
jgi:hypothetical protein